jgi:hypothetical protein
MGGQRKKEEKKGGGGAAFQSRRHHFRICKSSTVVGMYKGVVYLYPVLCVCVYLVFEW